MNEGGAGRAHDLAAVVDFGGPLGQLVARRVRQLEIYSELWPCHKPLADLLVRRPKAVILAGGPGGEAAPGIVSELLGAGLPVLGIGRAMEWMAENSGGARLLEGDEGGLVKLEVEAGEPLFHGIGAEEPAVGWMSAGRRLAELPPSFEAIAWTDSKAVAAMRHASEPHFAVRFHPESEQTPWGLRLLRNFLVGIAGCRQSWSVESFIDEEVERIRRQVGGGRAVCALSGGVDSTVAAALAHRAIGERLACIFVDHGLLRAGEAEEVARTFRGRFGDGFVHVEAAERFLARLEGVADPEEKRKRIGRTFIEIFEEEARRLGDVKYLVQGTVYPDVIESGSKEGGGVKSHHNVGGLPEKMDLELVEPLRALFKDEVRRLGEALGLPERLVWRQPFPGPGLAVRIIGPVTSEALRIERACDAIVTEEIARAGLDREVWQYFAVLTGIRSVGVVDGARSYGRVVAVRAVTSVDGMSAEWFRLPADVLDRIAGRIMREVPEVSRVVYDISSKPPATIEWE